MEGIVMFKQIWLLLIILIFALSSACQKEAEKPVQRKIESKTGVEGSDATSQEIATLNKKMDELMQGVQ